ncbi:MAG: hypothetical protein Q7T48_20030 [Cellvibrio sp.]|uniref:hypothetical protein n=1 Tax=Cellvibrio sp. TaxID=1965322 RepID=UPI002721C809|nr:hypothetical protein [Cellvibrio sp.]
MNSLLYIDPEINDQDVVYRTMDFFSIAAMIQNKSMMFTRADMFEDKNEGVERILSQLSISSPRSGCGMGWKDNATAKVMHQDIQRSHYVSCWSRNPDSVAMWSLYSSDLSSVRVSVRLSKLISVVENLLNKYLIAHLDENNLGKTLVGSVSGKIFPVRYMSLSYLSRLAQRRARALAKIDKRYEDLGMSSPVSGGSRRAFLRRLDQRAQLSEIGRLKDISFKHEEEIRLIVRLGEEVCTKFIVDSSRLVDPLHECHLAYKGYMEAWGYVKNTNIPSREFVCCPADLIETVAIDPRCSKHKVDFMNAWFNDHKIKVVKSNCFGYIPDELHVFPHG